VLNSLVGQFMFHWNDFVSTLFTYRLTLKHTVVTIFDLCDFQFFRRFLIQLSTACRPCRRKMLQTIRSCRLRLPLQLRARPLPLARVAMMMPWHCLCHRRHLRPPSSPIQMYGLIRIFAISSNRIQIYSLNLWASVGTLTVNVVLLDCLIRRLKF
jgi:hypothetical protein